MAQWSQVLTRCAETGPGRIGAVSGAPRLWVGASASGVHTTPSHWHRTAVRLSSWPANAPISRRTDCEISTLAVAERLQLTVTGADDYWANVGMTVQFLPFR